MGLECAQVLLPVNLVSKVTPFVVLPPIAGCFWIQVSELNALFPGSNRNFARLLPPRAPSLHCAVLSSHALWWSWVLSFAGIPILQLCIAVNFNVQMVLLSSHRLH